MYFVRAQVRQAEPTQHNRYETNLYQASTTEKHHMPAYPPPPEWFTRFLASLPDQNDVLYKQVISVYLQGR